MGSVIIHYNNKLNFRGVLLLKIFELINPLHAVIHYKRQPWSKSVDDLKSYPQNTLGNKLGNFLYENKLEPVDKAEKHDAYHVLLGYGTDIKEEAGMQFFLIGNRKFSPFSIGTSMLAAMVLPEKIGYFLKQLKNGYRSHSISKWDFKELLEDNYEDLRNIIIKEPVNNTSLMNKIRQFEMKS